MMLTRPLNACMVPSSGECEWAIGTDPAKADDQLPVKCPAGILGPPMFLHGELASAGPLESSHGKSFSFILSQKHANSTGPSDCDICQNRRSDT